MPFTPRSTVPALALLAVIGCQAKPAPLTGADVQALHAVTSTFQDRALAKDWDAVSQLYADSAVLLPPNAPAVHGRTAILRFFSAFPPIATLTLADESIEGAGDIAYGFGHYQLTLAQPGSLTDTGKYLNVLRKQKDGSWKYVADAWNSSLTLPAVH